MSRVSDTRLRTREAAARLVAAGRRSHELTVDLIYAEIKQGSRTTINDELKLWKDEQAKVDVLNSALPPAVANAMLTTWALAVEQGEKVFDQRREELDDELTRALEQKQVLATENANLKNDIASLRDQLESCQNELDGLRRECASEEVAKASARAQITTLMQQLDYLRNEGERILGAAKEEYQRRIDALGSAMTAQEQAFRAEIGKTTERLESVQRHVMLQVSEARDAHRRTEAQLSKAHQKIEQLTAEIQKIRTQCASVTQMKNQAQAHCESLICEVGQLRIERDVFIQQVATTIGKLSAQTDQIASLEHRATSAESRLDATLKQQAKSKKAA